MWKMHRAAFDIVSCISRSSVRIELSLTSIVIDLDTNRPYELAIVVLYILFGLFYFYFSYFVDQEGRTSEAYEETPSSRESRLMWCNVRDNATDNLSFSLALSLLFSFHWLLLSKALVYIPFRWTEGSERPRTLLAQHQQMTNVSLASFP